MQFCGGCMYWSSRYDKLDHGDCRRHAPRENSDWPRTRRTDECGEGAPSEPALAYIQALPGEYAVIIDPVEREEKQYTLIVSYERVIAWRVRHNWGRDEVVEPLLRSDIDRADAAVISFDSGIRASGYMEGDEVSILGVLKFKAREKKTTSVEMRIEDCPAPLAVMIRDAVKKFEDEVQSGAFNLNA